MAADSQDVPGTPCRSSAACCWAGCYSSTAHLAVQEHNPRKIASG
jgi:hypothetical protein